VTVESTEPLNARNPHYVRLNIVDAGKGFGIANYGFGGIAVKATRATSSRFGRGFAGGPKAHCAS